MAKPFFNDGQRAHVTLMDEVVCARTLVVMPLSRPVTVCIDRIVPTPVYSGSDHLHARMINHELAYDEKSVIATRDTDSLAVCCCFQLLNVTNDDTSI